MECIWATEARWQLLAGLKLPCPFTCPCGIVWTAGSSRRWLWPTIGQPGSVVFRTYNNNENCFHDATIADKLCVSSPPAPKPDVVPVPQQKTRPKNRTCHRRQTGPYFLRTYVVENRFASLSESPWNPVMKDEPKWDVRMRAYYTNKSVRFLNNNAYVHV